MGKLYGNQESYVGTMIKNLMSSTGDIERIKLVGKIVDEYNASV